MPCLFCCYKKKATRLMPACKNLCLKKIVVVSILKVGLARLSCPLLAFVQMLTAVFSAESISYNYVNIICLFMLD